MISLNILKFLENEGFGKIEESLFLETIPETKTGVYITHGATTTASRKRNRANFDLISKGRNNVDGLKRLSEIREALKNLTVCELEGLDGVSESVKSVRVESVGSIASLGLDTESRAVYSLAFTIFYN